MEEMEQSMRIVEQALRDIPGGPFQVNPETGRPVPASEMVDQAKGGNIPAIRDAHAVTDPTLEGSAKPLQVGIAAPEKRVFLPAKEDTYGNIEGLVQENFGHIPEDAEFWVGGLLDVAVSHVREATSFYSMFRTAPAGRRELRVCTSLPCVLRGAGDVMARLKDRLKTGADGTTAGG